MMDDPVQCYRISSNFRMLGSLPIEDVELYLTVCGTERCTSDKFYGPIVGGITMFILSCQAREYWRWMERYIILTGDRYL